MAVTTLAKVRSWVGKDTGDTANDAEITRCIAAVEVLLPQLANRLFAQATYTRYFDGDRLCGSRSIFLPSNHRPVAHSGSDLITVQENGSSITVAAIGYSATAAVLVSGAEIDSTCELIRQTARWATGVQNIKVAYKAGPTSVSADAEQLANELVWLMVTEPGRFAKLSNVRPGVANSFTRELPAATQLLLNRLTVWS